MVRKPQSRYDLPGSEETQAQPGSQGGWLGLVAAETRFNAHLLCRMHRDWLGGIYVWAGEYRNVCLSKGDFTWPPAVRVADNMATFETGLLARQTPCRPGSLSRVAQQIAEVHADLLLIHPFRRGNGTLAGRSDGGSSRAFAPEVPLRGTRQPR